MNAGRPWQRGRRNKIHTINIVKSQQQQKARANSCPATNNNKKSKCQALNAMRSPIRNLWTLNNNAMH